MQALVIHASTLCNCLQALVNHDKLAIWQRCRFHHGFRARQSNTIASLESPHTRGRGVPVGEESPVGTTLGQKDWTRRDSNLHLSASKISATRHWSAFPKESLIQSARQTTCPRDGLHDDTGDRTSMYMNQTSGSHCTRKISEK